MNTLRDILHKPLLKFYRLESKLFWRDEISSVLYTSGIKDSTYLDKIPVHAIRNIGFYDNLLHLGTQPYPLTSEISGILSDTPLTPAHYIFLTLWYRLVGDDMLDYRLFSLLIKIK
jgi:hypothetical protein